jgi:hypothetical protein
MRIGNTNKAGTAAMMKRARQPQIGTTQPATKPAIK